LHTKPALETPSSTATATRETVILGLSSPSPNCGMALARTPVHVGEANDPNLDALYGHLVSRLPLKRSSPELSPTEMVDVLVRGAEAVLERYDLDPATLDHMDQRGNALPPGADPAAVLDAVPQALHEIGRWRFGRIGEGNHFLELQVVDEVRNSAIAQAWGLEQGQLVFMYHADSDYVGGFIGRIYSHRRKNTWRGRLHEWRIKVPFLLTAGQSRRMLHRLYYHMLPHRWVPILADSEEGRRALLGLQAASNYAYANRLAVLASLRDAIRAIWGMQRDPPCMLWDAPHNSIRQERIDGQELWVHRHNAARALPPSQVPAGSPFAYTGQPVLLPGTDRTSSYLCVAGEGAVHTLHSVDHGAGHSALLLASPLSHGPTTRLYTYANGLAEIRPHLSDTGLDAVLAVLHEYDVAHPVVRLRPLAVLKGQA
jgi:tRNA-splicing ligase RtcB